MSIESYFKEYKSLFDSYNVNVSLIQTSDDAAKPIQIIRKKNEYIIVWNIKTMFGNEKVLLDNCVRTIILQNFILYTSRVCIRNYRMEDFEDTYEMVSNPNIALNDGYKTEDDKEHFQKVFKTYCDSTELLAVELLSEHKVIGGISLRPNSTRYVPCFDIGYNINEDYWKQGYGYEATYAVINFLFRKLNIEMMTCSHFENNHASQALIKKLGFQYEGYLRNSFYHTAFGPMDLMVYSQTKDEWIEREGEE